MKKFLSLALSASMATALLVGCGNSGNSTGSDNVDTSGELVWKIPVGWHRKGASGDVFYVLRADHEINLGYDTRPLVFKSVYSQRFHVDQAGETRVDKFGHWTSRSRFCRVVLDGNTLQESHPTW